MAQELSRLLSKAMSDKELFGDLITDPKAALAARRVKLSPEEMKVLDASLTRIRVNIGEELMRLKLTSVDGMAADGIIGW